MFPLAVQWWSSSSFNYSKIHIVAAGSIKLVSCVRNQQIVNESFLKAFIYLASCWTVIADGTVAWNSLAFANDCLHVCNHVWNPSVVLGRKIQQHMPKIWCALKVIFVIFSQRIRLIVPRWKLTFKTLTLKLNMAKKTKALVAMF